MPIPHLIAGRIYSFNGDLVSGAQVTCGSVSATSNSLGEYVLSVSGNDGDSVSLLAYKEAVGRKTVSINLTSAPLTQDFTLEQTSDLDYFSTPQERYPLNFCMLVDYEGNKFSKENPLSVISTIDVSPNSFDLVNNPSVSLGNIGNDGQADYIEVTINGVTYRRTYTYTEINRMRMLSGWSKWVKQ